MFIVDSCFNHFTVVTFVMGMCMYVCVCVCVCECVCERGREWIRCMFKPGAADCPVEDTNGPNVPCLPRNKLVCVLDVVHLSILIVYLTDEDIFDKRQNTIILICSY